MSIYLSFFDIFEVYVDRIDNFVNHVAKPQIPGKPKKQVFRRLGLPGRCEASEPAA